MHHVPDLHLFWLLCPLIFRYNWFEAHEIYSDLSGVLLHIKFSMEMVVMSRSICGRGMVMIRIMKLSLRILTCSEFSGLCWICHVPFQHCMVPGYNPNPFSSREP